MLDTKARTKQQEGAINQLNDSINQDYHTIYETMRGNDKNDLTIIKTFQKIGKTLEEMFRLEFEDPEFQISTICELVIKGCRARGFTEGQCNYVYEAFDPPEFQKYKRLIEHSSSHSLDKSRDHKEDSSIRLTLFKKYIDKAYSQIMPIGSVERMDHQDAADYSLDKYDNYEQELRLQKIPLTKNRQEDPFDSGKGMYEDKIQYAETTPAKTILSEACIEHGETWIQVGKIIEKEGIVDPETGKVMLTDDEIKLMADAVKVWTMMLKPILDRKWRLDFMHWADVIKKANEWFKHTASTSSKIKDFKGFYRCVTREQIGARKNNLPDYFKRVVELSPHYFRIFTIWMPNVRLPREADFSTRLSPKLSEQSLR